MADNDVTGVKVGNKTSEMPKTVDMSTMGEPKG